MSEKKTILVVEDEADTALFLKDRLEMEGYEVITASDGQEGLEKAQGENPALILLDVMMPKMDGYQVCRMLKFDDKFKQIPIILLTARAQEQDIKTGKKVGADDYMMKPLELRELLGKIEGFLGK